MRLAVDDEVVADRGRDGGIDLEQESPLALEREMRRDDDAALAHQGRQRLAANGRGRPDRHLDELPQPRGGLVEPKAPERLAGQRGQREDGGGEQRGTQGEDVVDRLAEPGEQVLVEHAQDDADLAVEAAHEQGRRDVEQIVGGQHEDAARVGDVRLLEDFAPPTVAAHQPGTAETRIVGLADGVDDDDREPGLVQVFEDTRTHPAQAAEDEGTIHETSGGSERAAGVSVWGVGESGLVVGCLSNYVHRDQAKDSRNGGVAIRC